MYYIVYKTTNTINGKFYIGVHKTKDLDDGYLGSGVAIQRAIKKYDVSNFLREIIHIGTSEEECYELEELIVDEEFVARRDTYNMKVGGRGGVCEYTRIKLQEYWDNVSKEEREERGRKSSIALKKRWNSLSQEQKDAQLLRLQEARESKTPEEKQASKEKRAATIASWSDEKRESVSKNRAKPTGEGNPISILTEAQIFDIFNLHYFKNMSSEEVSLMYPNVSTGSIKNYVNGIARRTDLDRWLDLNGIDFFQFRSKVKKGWATGLQHSQSKATPETIREALKHFINGNTITDCGAVAGITRKSFSSVLKRETWKAVTEEFLINNNITDAQFSSLVNNKNKRKSTNGH